MLLRSEDVLARIWGYLKTFGGLGGLPPKETFWGVDVVDAAGGVIYAL